MGGVGDELGVGFDLDDTLIPTQSWYDEIKHVVAEHCKQDFRLPYPVDAIVEQLDAIDAELVDDMGYDPERFPTACADTYRYYAEETGAAVAESDVQRIYDIGAQVVGDETFYRERGFLPGATETLDFFQDRADIHLITAGDDHVQQTKIDALDLGHWFDYRIHIVPVKDADTLQQVLGDYGTSWFVGNSPRSDIQPAVEAGIGAVHVPGGTWTYEETDVPEADQVITVETIDTLPTIYEQLH